MWRLWLLLMVMLIACLFLMPANVMASFDEGGPPGIVLMEIADIGTMISSMSCMAGGDDCGKRSILLKDDTMNPTDWQSAISPIACGNNVLQHGHPGGVSMALG